MIKYDNKMPNGIENVNGKQYFLINIEISEATNEELRSLWNNFTGHDGTEIQDWFIADNKYRYRSIEVPKKQWTRDGIVDAIIRDKYRIDEMEAITNNMAAINAVFMQTLVTEGIVAATKYLKESINDENTARFKEMQEWRAMAKQVAKDTLKL